jgi:hypothetical protein
MTIVDTPTLHTPYYWREQNILQKGLIIYEESCFGHYDPFSSPSP